MRLDCAWLCKRGSGEHLPTRLYCVRRVVTGWHHMVPQCGEHRVPGDVCARFAPARGSRVAAPKEGLPPDNGVALREVAPAGAIAVPSAPGRGLGVNVADTGLRRVSLP
jgi:hypothetical protein